MIRPNPSGHQNDLLNRAPDAVKILSRRLAGGWAKHGVEHVDYIVCAAPPLISVQHLWAGMLVCVRRGRARSGLVCLFDRERNGGLGSVTLRPNAEIDARYILCSPSRKVTIL
jgi:hypothetical protein